MACQRRLDRNTRSLDIADLADHDDVRVLTKDGAQRMRKIQPNFRLDLDLVDALHLVFNGVLNRKYLSLGAIEQLQRRIKRRRLAAARRAGDQNDSVWLLQQPFERRDVVGGKA